MNRLQYFVDVLSFSVGVEGFAGALDIRTKGEKDSFDDKANHR